jgi:hypothetical protein
MFSAQMVQEQRLPTQYPPPKASVTCLPLSHHAIYHVISPSCHILKERPLVWRVIREQSLLTISRAEFFLAAEGKGPPCCNGNVSFLLGMLQRGFLFGMILLFAWACYCPI